MPIDPLIAPGDIMELTAYCQLGNQVSINRTHFICTSIAGLGVDLSIGLQSAEAAYQVNLPALLSSAANYCGCLWRRVWPLARKTTYLSIRRRLAGTGGPNPLPRQVCGMFTKGNGLPGRNNRGRMYVPFPDVLSQTPGQDLPLAAYMVNLGIFSGSLATTLTPTFGLSSCSLSPVIFRRSAPAASPPWISATAKQAWATHRSRGDFGAPNVLPSPLV
jgi:hypothetical protein